MEKKQGIPAAAAGQNTRQQIIEAALRLASREGGRSVTLDAVASECGLSKGGLLYHFGSRHALLEGLLQHLLAEGRERRRALLQGQPGLSVLMASLSLQSQKDQALDRNTTQALLVAANENPDLLKPVRDYMAELAEDIGGVNLEDQAALVLWLAGEALVLKDLLGISPFSGQESNTIRQYLIDQAHQLEKERT